MMLFNYIFFHDNSLQANQDEIQRAQKLIEKQKRRASEIRNDIETFERYSDLLKNVQTFIIVIGVCVLILTFMLRGMYHRVFEENWWTKYVMLVVFIGSFFATKYYRKYLYV